MVDFLRPTGKGSWGADGGSSIAPTSGKGGKGSWGSSLSGLLPWVGAAQNAGNLIQSLFFGKVAPQKDAVYSPSTTENNLGIDYNQDSQISGGENTLTYKVTGVSNQAALWNPFVCVFGEKVKFFPVKGMESYGSGAFNIGCLDLGYGELELDPAYFSIGGRPLSDFPGLVTEIQYGKANDPAFVTSLAASSGSSVGFSLGIADGYKTVRVGRAGTSMGITITFPYGCWDKNIYFPAVFEPYAVSFGIEYKKTTDIAWSSGGSLNVVENTQVAFSRSVSWAISSDGIYDVRVYRASGGENFPYGVYADGEARATWDSVSAFYNAPDPPFTDVFDSKGNKIYIPRILLKTPNNADGANAQNDFSCLASRKLRRWDGTQWTAPAVSSHPPDIVLEILTGQANFDPVAEEDIDLDSFREWSIFCFNNDFTYRKVVDQGVTLQALIDEVAAAGRANVVNINGKHTAIVDKPRPHVTQHFSLRTIIKDSFTSHASLGLAPNVIYAAFLNPDSDWQQDEIEVYDDGYDATHKTLIPENRLFPGCTNSTEAHKRARYLMATTRLQFWTYTFRAAASYLACRIGDRIRVRHDSIFAGIGQGRIVGLIENDDGDLIAIRLDAQQEIEAGKTYALRILVDRENELQLEVTNAAGFYQEFQLADPIPASDLIWPTLDSQALFGEIDYESIDMLITEISPGEDFTAQITAVDYNDGVYTAYNETIPTYVSRIASQRDPEYIVGMPTVLSVDSGNAALLSLGAGRFASGILLTLIPEQSPIIYYEAQAKPSALPDVDASWSPSVLYLADSGQARIGGVFDGVEYDIRIRNRRADNGVSSWFLAADNHLVVGQTAKPPNVPGIVQRLPNTKIIRWFYDAEHGVTVPPDHAGFKLKMVYSSSPNWQHGLLITSRHTSTQFDFAGLASGLKTIMIKAVDFQGNEQDGDPAFLVTDLGDIEVANVVDRVMLSPIYNGVTINSHTMSSPTELNWFPVNLSDPWFPANLSDEFFPIGHVPNRDGSIGAESISPTFFPANLSDPWFPAALSDPWTSRTFRALVAEFTINAPNDLVYPAALKLDYTVDGAFTIEYRKKKTLPFFPVNLSDPWFPAALSDPWLTVDNPAWLPYNDAGIPLDKNTVYTLVWNTPFFPANLSDPLFPTNLSDPWFDLGTPVYTASEEPGIPEDRTWEFRLLGAAGIVQSVIKTLGYFWDVPDRTEYVNDFIVDSLFGKRLPLLQSFRRIKSISPSVEMTPEYPDARSANYEGKASGSPSIYVFDGAGNPALGKVDVIVKGY